MNSSDSADGQLPEMQFTTHEPLGPEADVQTLSCITCKQPIENTYFALGDQVLCPSCRERASASPKGSGLVRFVKAACFGTLAGLLGALIWYLIRVIANIELGLIAILVGLMVGKAVHRASAGKGGISYQILAVFITYSCISANYVPDIFQAMLTEFAQQSDDRAAETAQNGEAAPAGTAVESGNDAIVTETKTEAAKENPAGFKSDKPSAISIVLAVILVTLVAFAFAFASPVLLGLENPIGLIIVGIALWEAWKFSANRPIPITGPYQVRPQSGAPETSL